MDGSRSGYTAAGRPSLQSATLIPAGLGPLVRKDVGQTDVLGQFSTDIQNAVSTPCPGAVNIAPGATWNFQYWHRQPMGAPATFSEAIAVTFQ